jgi:hypothetical protein
MAELERSSEFRACLPNLALGDQGAPPMAARSPVALATWAASIAARPAAAPLTPAGLRGPATARDGSATTGGADLAGPSSPFDRVTPVHRAQGR